MPESDTETTPAPADEKPAKPPRAAKPPRTETPDETPDTGQAEPDTPDEAEPQRVILEQAPAAPAVYYGDDAQQPPAPPTEHVRANYQKFDW